MRVTTIRTHVRDRKTGRVHPIKKKAVRRKKIAKRGASHVHRRTARKTIRRTARKSARKSYRFI
jgi:hypothetical protein